MELNINNQTQPIVNRVEGLLDQPELNKELSMNILKKFDDYKFCCLIDNAWDAVIKMVDASAPDIGEEKSQRLVRYLESDQYFDHFAHKMAEHFESVVVECYIRANSIVI
ncbi:hypothetical protein [Paenibacillus xylanexedens]|uniref:hypothetical protein n=1 Tax=Paenibacillus xylanexedens TaxID=528191 RepID=UPI00119DDCDE|nr:hypothetical protein [Paenibacillus xylanexedens]